MNKHNFSLSIVGFLLSLTACVSSTKPNPDLVHAGTTPITLSQNTSAAFQRYLDNPNRRAFAVNVTGSGSYWVQCKENNCSFEEGSPAAHALNQCNVRHFSACKLFALGTDIVWKGQVDWPIWDEGQWLFSLSYNKFTGKPGQTTALGKARYFEEDENAVLEIRFKGYQCAGNAELRLKTWKLICEKEGEEKTLSGKLKRLRENKYEGRSVLETPTDKFQFIVGSPPPGTVSVHW